MVQLTSLLKKLALNARQNQCGATAFASLAADAAGAVGCAP
jgi:hypothetical protein